MTRRFFYGLTGLMFFLFIGTVAQAEGGKATITIDVNKGQDQINKNIYGQFSEHLGHCIYGGIWVGEDSPIPNTRGIRNDVVEALKEIKVPLLRWPGGCFADEYHWMDGIGPRDQRPSMINTNWGGVVEDNSFGTHEFMDFCQMIGAEPYFSGNVGSGTVEEMSKWVEYLNSDNVSPMTKLRQQNGREKSWGVKYWGIGNESWGCGGNMRPEYYADLLRRFATYLRNYGDNKIYRIAVGPNGADYNWTETVMQQSLNYMDAMSLHYYYNYHGETATGFTEKGWFDVMKETLMMDELITKHSAIMDKYDPNKKIALAVDEWGTWLDVEPGTNPSFLYQQNTLRDALSAGTTLNIFNNHCDRVRIANIAQMVNVLQAMILTDGDKMVLTPTYYVFDLYKVHMDAILLPMEINSSEYTFNGESLPSVNCSASFSPSGKMHITLCNINPEAHEEVAINIRDFGINKIAGKILTSEKMTDHNTFDNSGVVKPVLFSDFKNDGGKLTVNMPSKSIVMLELDADAEAFLGKDVEISNPEKGVSYKYYEKSMIVGTNEIDGLEPLKTGIVDQFQLIDDAAISYYAMEYNGYINIPENGWYTFYTSSDDGTVLYIDDHIVVNNDGNHGIIERSGYTGLKKGLHKIKVLYYQNQGGTELSVSFSGPNLEKQVIPADILFHKTK